MLPLAILVTGDPVDPVQKRRGSFADLIRGVLGDAWSGPVAVLDARRGERPRAEELAALVITGSPASVTSREPWIVEAEAGLRELVAAGTPVLGICFGHQLLTQALGGNVTLNPRGREIGTVELELTGDDPLFERSPSRFSTNMSHVDSAERLPANARVLGTTRLDPHSAVRFDERVWGVQFHPEFDGDVVRGYIDARREHLTREGLPPDSLTAVDTPQAAELLRRFAELSQSR